MQLQYVHVPINNASLTVYELINRIEESQSRLKLCQEILSVGEMLHVDIARSIDR